MTSTSVVKVLSMHWGFIPGGVAYYSAHIDAADSIGPVTIRSVVVLRRGLPVDTANLALLRDRKVIERSNMWPGAWLKELREEFQSCRAQLVISHGFNAHFIVFVARLLGWLDAVPIATYHGPYHAMSTLGLIKKLVFDIFTDFYLKHCAHAVAAVAGHGREDLLAKGIDARKVVVIHNGIPDADPDSAARERLRREWQIKPDTVLIGILSRLEPVKGIVDAIEAMALIARECAAARMLIVGIGTQEAELKRLVKSRGLEDRISFAGFRSDVADCYTAFDIFLLPSLSECHSIALLEAMRAARPIVATAVGGNVETVSAGVEAELVPVNAPRAIADGLLSLIRDPRRARLLGEAARRRFLADFTSEVSLRKTVHWLLGCAAAQSAGPSVK